jgi:hypothetical protein
MTYPHPDSDPLDRLLAEARQPTPADEGAAGRFLSGHRARLARQRRRTWAGGLSALLASAAAVAGVAALRPSSPLPVSAAYDVYVQAAYGGTETAGTETETTGAEAGW